GSQRNLSSVRPFLRGPTPNEATLKILADAQTSGGLLISVDADRASALVAALNHGRSSEAVVIGEITAGAPSVAFS
ncbi:MAG: selenide, water dikinase SelD, partial [Acidimicrobiia bacterium]